ARARRGRRHPDLREAIAHGTQIPVVVSHLDVHCDIRERLPEMPGQPVRDAAVVWVTPTGLEHDIGQTCTIRSSTSGLSEGKNSCLQNGQISLATSQRRV